MFKRLIVIALINSHPVAAQEPVFDPLSLEFQLGLNNPVRPFATGYDAQSPGFFHGSLGMRYMFNPKFGLSLQTAFDQFRNDAGTLPFSTSYIRVSAEGVMNIGNIFRFYDWTNRFGLLLHTGGGYSTMKEKNSKFAFDQMTHVMVGITPQLRLNNRWSIFLDATSIVNMYQSRTYDFSEANDQREGNGKLSVFSLGVRCNLGKGMSGDWVVPVDWTNKLDEIDQRIATLQDRQKDDDGDGVANYLDQEPGTAAGANVNTKGQTQILLPRDSDGDAVPDLSDECPFEKGRKEADGCPDADADGIPDKSDECPLIAGTSTGGGCPDIPFETLEKLEMASAALQFQTGKYDLPPAALAQLDAIAAEMRQYPKYKLVIAAHTGAEGDNLKNMTLSQRRADAVKQYLVGKGIPGSRLLSLGFGETQPVADNSTAEGNTRNERVELTVRF